MSDSDQHGDSFSGRMADAPDTPETPPQVPPATPPASTPPPPPAAAPVPEWQPGTDGPSGPRASFGRRFVAYFIDLVLLAVITGILSGFLDRDVADLIAFAIAVAYFSILEGGPRGQTLGKQALGIRVVDHRSGGPIGYGRGVLRYFARILSALACLLGYLWMLWDREKQCWHDKIASDFVVPVRYYPVN